MQHLHRLEIRINIPRRAPMNIQIDAQDVLPLDVDMPQVPAVARQDIAEVVMPR